jgi:hypothetical protein
MAVIELVAQAADKGTSLTPVIITGVVTLVVGIIMGAVAATTGVLGRRTEREKLAHEKEKFATETRDKVKEDFVAVVEAMGIIQIGDDVELTTRQAAAGKALGGLLSISFMMPGVGGRHLEQLLDALQTADEDSLKKALLEWPSVSTAIRRKPPEPSRAGRWRRN